MAKTPKASEGADTTPPKSETNQIVEELLERLGDDFQILLREAAENYDPVAVSAVRLVHAVIYAARRKDEVSISALQECEQITLRYMQKHARDEYFKLCLAPRADHDRHMTVLYLRERVMEYLQRCDQAPHRTGAMEDALAYAFDPLGVCELIGRYFPDLKPLMDKTRAAPATKSRKRSESKLFERFAAQRAAGLPFAKLDPELVIIDALELLGVPRKQGHGWFRFLK